MDHVLRPRQRHPSATRREPALHKARLSYATLRFVPEDSDARSIYAKGIHKLLENVVGKYFIGWLLGVPVFVLVIAYIFFR